MAGPEIQVRFPDNRNPEVAGQSGVRTGWTTDVLGHDAVQVTHLPLEPSGEYAEWGSVRNPHFAGRRDFGRWRGSRVTDPSART